MRRMFTTIYTDGSCLKNPGGPGGWAWVNVDNLSTNLVFSNSGRDRKTTNNRMELTAVIQAIQENQEYDKLTIHSDSKYVVTGITDWSHRWNRKKWKGVKNVDLWKKLYKIVYEKPVVERVEWRWVKAHAGDEYNEMVDKLAREEAYKCKAS